MRALIVALLLGLAGLAPAAAGGRYALVIGNSNYVGDAVSGVEDARLIADDLKQVGFARPDLRTDASYADMTTALKKLEGQIADADVVVFFFSGHGLQRNGENYLLSVDGRPFLL